MFKKGYFLFLPNLEGVLSDNYRFCTTKTIFICLCSKVDNFNDNMIK